MLSSQIDSQGRFIFLLGNWDSHVCIIANIYIPPPFNIDVLRCLFQFLVSHPQIPVLAVGDFNNVLDTSLDLYKQFCPQGPRVPTPFARHISEIGLIDLWHCKQLLKAQFSCHSLTHSSLSRIHLVLGTDLTLSFDPNVTYLTRGLSDHSPVQLTLSLHSSRLPTHWKFNPF